MPANNFDTEDLDFARNEDVESLFHRYQQRTLAFIASLGLRGADAEDVQQRAWMRVVEGLRKKPFEGHFRGWLFQIVRNAAIDMMRKKRPDSMTAEIAAATIASGNCPEQPLIDREYQSAVSSCVEALESEHRKIVQGRLAGENYETIASRLNISTSRAHRIFFDAKNALRECLQGRFSEVV